MTKHYLANPVLMAFMLVITIVGSSVVFASDDNAANQDEAIVARLRAVKNDFDQKDYNAAVQLIEAGEELTLRNLSASVAINEIWRIYQEGVSIAGEVPAHKWHDDAADWSVDHVKDLVASSIPTEELNSNIAFAFLDLRESGYSGPLSMKDCQNYFDLFKAGKSGVVQLALERREAIGLRKDQMPVVVEGGVFDNDVEALSFTVFFFAGQDVTRLPEPFKVGEKYYIRGIPLGNYAAVHGLMEDRSLKDGASLVSSKPDTIVSLRP